MDFGRLKRLEGIDWRLPPDAPATEKRLAETRPPGRLRYACPVWTHSGFLGKIFPAGTPARDYLRHYAEHFDAIELNTTWYGYDAERVRRWRDQTPEDFRFLPKLPQAISHDARFAGVERELEHFCETMRLFGGRLGPAWTILPPAFGPDDLPRLTEFLSAWPADLRLAVELRDPAWFRDAGALEAVSAELEARGMSLVLADVAGRRDVLHQRLTSDSQMIRFAGHHLDPSDFARLDDWAPRLSRWLTRGIRELVIVFHQPEEHLGVELAIHLAKRLGDLSPPPPRPRPVEDQGLLF